MSFAYRRFGSARRAPVEESTPEETHQRHEQLARILTGEPDAAAAVLGPSSAPALGGNLTEAELAADFDPALCIECQDHPADLVCHGCADDKYCSVCFHAQHRKSPGRLAHKSTPIHGGAAAENGDAAAASAAAANGDAMATDSPMDTSSAESPTAAPAPAAAPAAPVVASPSATHNAAEFGAWLTERCQWIPVRMSLPERKLLRLLDAALRVSEYTDRVDILAAGSRTQRMVTQIREVCQTLAGLVVAADYQLGQELFADRDFAANAAWYAHVFELGRRHKILNPDKMRATYGKLIVLLQDAALPEVQRLLGFDVIAPVKTVHRVLSQHGALHLLMDPMVLDATAEIISDGKPRRVIDAEIRRKEHAVDTLARKYATPSLTADDLRSVLYSIGDHHHYLHFHRDPCDHLLKHLNTFFGGEEPVGGSLAIRAGSFGARLTHSHAKQYAYVSQSLALWREIENDMFMLWSLAEADLLSSDGYRLRNTGQGLNRVQACPNVGRAMHAILRRAQTRLGSWVGSSVIHLGDENVPNALMFIDKYTQVPRILHPVLKAVDRLESEIHAHPALREFLRAQYGADDTVRRAQCAILEDFFKHAFDGSGADNFNSAGSCIDGRLTSAWNWCSAIEKKPYFPIFLLTGFVGFDGESFDV
ncbi:hypothetical protein H9P43_003881 [Blastocladiella emersonii ATCC 22665]|nr:hypothetical protein H9P43_003881 [Blastocladiella emersonii ATCC 22665]